MWVLHAVVGRWALSALLYVPIVMEFRVATFPKYSMNLKMKTSKYLKSVNFYYGKCQMILIIITLNNERNS
jgi:hypothetical protein